jgi:hypothetical protein
MMVVDNEYLKFFDEFQAENEKWGFRGLKICKSLSSSEGFGILPPGPHFPFSLRRPSGEADPDPA